MSPARSKRQPVPHRYSRAEIVKAVGVGAGIVAATALLIWLMRPGPAGIPATGGLMNRQPRASWLVGAINTTQLRHTRRWAAVGITTFAAIITPSQDPFSLLFMAVPMYIFYEGAILVGRILKR